MTKQITLNDKTVSYELIRKNVKNINLRIKPNGDILVSANNFVFEKTIENFILSKKDFILNALEKNGNRKVLTSDIKNNRLLLLGKYYPIKILNGENFASFANEKIILSIKNEQQKEAVLTSFYKKECEKIVTEICKKVYPLFLKHVPNFPEIKFRNMKSRWGSCMPIKNILTFNYKLVLIPPSLIEYVVFHEFCHYIEPNHSKNFYFTLSNFLPDYKEREKLIKTYNVVDFYDHKKHEDKKPE